MPCILVVTSHPHFAEGGHLVMARELVSALRREGHDAELWLTPQNRFGRQASAYLATWLTDVGQTHDGRPIDQVISLRFPSYAVRHPRHVCWLNHTMREYYDLWPRFSADLSWKNAVKERIRRAAIRAADRRLLGHVDRLFVLSDTVNRRLDEAIGLRGEVLYPPAPPRDYRTDAYEPYLLAVSRLVDHKRLDLLVRAAATPDGRAVRLVIGGDGEARPALEALARTLGVADRVTFEGRLDEAGLVRHLARCRAVCFAPLAEDFGFVTVEAFQAGKAVLTTRDSGGPAELVHDDVDGFVREATPEALGAAMRVLMEDEARARRMGAAAAGRAAELSWSAAIRRLVIV